eukprot:4925030-Pyramimonas_sp.AAC.2
MLFNGARPGGGTARHTLRTWLRHTAFLVTTGRGRHEAVVNAYTLPRNPKDNPKHWTRNYDVLEPLLDEKGTVRKAWMACGSGGGLF